MTKQLCHSNTSVYNIGYHIVFCPKYRRKILVGCRAERMKKLLFRKSYELNITIQEIEVMPDHVHLFIKAKPFHSIDVIVKHLKGFSSYMLRREFPEISYYKTLWTKGYFVESCGCISEDTIKRYINNQWNK